MIPMILLLWRDALQAVSSGKQPAVVETQIKEAKLLLN